MAPARSLAGSSPGLPPSEGPASAPGWGGLQGPTHRSRASRPLSGSRSWLVRAETRSVSMGLGQGGGVGKDGGARCSRLQASCGLGRPCRAEPSLGAKRLLPAAGGPGGGVGHEARGLPPMGLREKTHTLDPRGLYRDRVQPRPRGEAHRGGGRTRVWAGHSLSAWLPRPPKAAPPRLPRPPKVLGLLKGSGGSGRLRGLRGSCQAPSPVALGPGRCRLCSGRGPGSRVTSPPTHLSPPPRFSEATPSTPPSTPTSGTYLPGGPWAGSCRDGLRGRSGRRRDGQHLGAGWSPFQKGLRVSLGTPPPSRGPGRTPGAHPRAEAGLRGLPQCP